LVDEWVGTVSNPVPFVAGIWGVLSFWSLVAESDDSNWAADGELVTTLNLLASHGADGSSCQDCGCTGGAVFSNADATCAEATCDFCLDKEENCVGSENLGAADCQSDSAAIWCNLSPALRTDVRYVGHDGGDCGSCSRCLHLSNGDCHRDDRRGTFESCMADGKPGDHRWCTVLTTTTTTTTTTAGTTATAVTATVTTATTTTTTVTTTRIATATTTSVEGRTYVRISHCCGVIALAEVEAFDSNGSQLWPLGIAMSSAVSNAAAAMCADGDAATASRTVAGSVTNLCQTRSPDSATNPDREAWLRLEFEADADIAEVVVTNWVGNGEENGEREQIVGAGLSVTTDPEGDEVVWSSATGFAAADATFTFSRAFYTRNQCPSPWVDLLPWERTKYAGSWLRTLACKGKWSQEERVGWWMSSCRAASGEWKEVGLGYYCEWGDLLGANGTVGDVANICAACARVANEDGCFHAQKGYVYSAADGSWSVPQNWDPSVMSRLDCQVGFVFGAKFSPSSSFSLCRCVEPTICFIEHSPPQQQGGERSTRLRW
jgi:hypothetical protein